MSKRSTEFNVLNCTFLLTDLYTCSLLKASTFFPTNLILQICQLVYLGNVCCKKEKSEKNKKKMMRKERNGEMTKSVESL